MKLFEKKSMKNVQIFLEKDITNLLELRNVGETSIFDKALCIMTCFENHAFRPTRIGAKVTMKHRVLQIITLGRI